MSNTSGNEIETKYWENISPYIKEMPHIGNLAQIVYGTIKEDPNFDLGLFSAELKAYSYEHAIFVVEMYDAGPEQRRYIECLGIDVSKIRALVNNYSYKQPESVARDIELEPAFAEALVTSGGDIIQDSLAMLMRRLDPNILSALPQKASSAIKGGRFSFYESKIGHELSHWLVMIFGLADLASDVFPDGEALMSAIAERSINGLEVELGLGILRGIVELIAVNQLTNSYKSFRSGEILKASKYLGLGVVASIISISSFLTTHHFVLNSQPPHWLVANGQFLHSLSSFLLAFIINYGAEINLLLENIEKEKNGES